MSKFSNPYNELGVIETSNLRNKKILVCLESKCKQRFFEAREFQVSIIEVICESEEKDIICYDVSKFPAIKVTGFKFSFKGIPVIGYKSMFGTGIYGIPIQIYGSEGVGVVSSAKKVNETTGEYHLFNAEGELIENWPPVE